MPRFKVVEGKLSNKYNHFKDYRFENCIATDTRLMGVIALKVFWTAKTNNKDRLFQIIHLDFSEYGIDEYKEIFTHTMDFDGGREVKTEWKRVSGGLGGKEVKIPFFTMIQLIDEVLKTNEAHYKNHPPYIQQFRQETLMRIAFMKEATKKLQYDGKHFEDKSRECMSLVVKSPLSAYEIINYFIMRLLDKDYKGAALLANLSETKLKHHRLAEIGLTELVKNKIKKEISKNESHNEPPTYRCKFLALGDKYIYGEMLLTLSPRSLTRHRSITDFRIMTLMKISSFEAAFILREPEYITLYKLKVSYDEFDIDDTVFGADTSMSPVPNGILYVLYNKDNAHVNSSNYYMNHDLYGAYLLTPNNEFIMMSNDLVHITNMEMDINRSANFAKLELTGKYKLDTQIFQTFAESTGAYFKDMILSPEDDNKE